MRTRMTVARCPTSPTAETTTVVNYLSEKFPLMQPYDANSRLPRTVLTRQGHAISRSAYELVNTHAEPHDVAVDPKGNPWVAERAGKLGRLDAKTLEFIEIDTPPGPAAADRQSLGQSADRFQGHAVGARWPQQPLAQLRHYDRQIPRLCVAEGTATLAATAWRCILTAPSGQPAAATRRASLIRRRSSSSSSRRPAPRPSKIPGAYGIAVAGDGSVWLAEDEADLMARVDPATGKVDEFKIPV